MSRKETTCLNCGTPVTGRYCSHCGQENKINRPSFYYLFTQFFEGLTNYDSKFWVTIKVLLFRPGRIISEYLKGRRSSFVDPVRLYIFTSFIAFLLPGMKPTVNTTSGEAEKEVVKEEIPEIISSVKTADSLENTETAIAADSLDYTIGFTENYKDIRTVAEFDSIHASLSDKDKMPRIFVKPARKLVELNQRRIIEEEDLGKKFVDLYYGHFPTMLFLYLPVFAFFLWVVHSKKKWLYYDHGVFTLYYFSLLMIMICFSKLTNLLFDSVNDLFPKAEIVTSKIGSFFSLILLGYAFFYFFRSHSRVYLQSKTISRITGTGLFFLNGIFFFLWVMIYLFITLMRL